MTRTVDLTEYSVTFPTLPDILVPQTNWVHWMHDRFSPERKIIVVQAPDGSGKTTLLAQFAKTYSDRCFSFFITPDRYRTNARRFYQELCAQLSVVVRGRSLSTLTDRPDQYELQSEFGDLYHDVARRAKKTGQSYFFVIDGLEWDAESLEEESIRRLLPVQLYPNIYLLASSRPNDEFDFHIDSEKCPLFSEPETADYFVKAGISLNKDELGTIYHVCRGMPGYLDQLRREAQETGRTVSELVEDLPSGFRELLERTWERLPLNQEKLELALALLAYSRVPLELTTIASFLEVDQSALAAILEQTPILEREERYRFVTDAHRQFAAQKLESKRQWVERVLIDHYSATPYSRESLENLPALLKETGNYERLTKLITIDYLIRTLQEQRDFYLLSRNVALVAHEANYREDWETLSKYTLVSAILHTLATEPTMEREVEALLSIDDYEQSYALATSSTILPIDRLQLLARIGSAMRQEGRAVPEVLLLEVEQLVAQVPPTEGLKDRILRIAANLFHVHPQAATNLVNKVLQIEPEGRTADVLLALLALQLQSDESDYVETLRSQITDKKLRDFTRAHAPELSQRSAVEVLLEADQIEDSSFRLLLLRSWCNAHRHDPAAIEVIQVALELMTAAKPNPSMRHLRQFAEPLRSVGSREFSEIIERFDVLKETALKEPIEELVRLELLLAKVEADSGYDEAARRRLAEVCSLMEEQAELDVRCYILARILLSLPDIRVEFDRGQRELQAQLEIEYERLLEDSAQQWIVTERLFGVLARYDKLFAVELAARLNVLPRRDRAYSKIAVVYSQEKPAALDFDYLRTTLERIDEPDVHDWTVVRVLQSLEQNDARGEADSQMIEQLRQLIVLAANIRHPIPRSLAWSFAYSMYVPHDSKAAKGFLEQMCASWREIDDSLSRVEVGYELATNLAKADVESAKNIIAETRKLRNESILSVEVIAEVVVNAIRLVLRAMPDIAKQDEQSFSVSRQRLLDLIFRIPSEVFRSKLVTEMITRLISAGRRDEANKIIQTYVRPRLGDHSDHELSFHTLLELAPSIYEYEQSALIEEASRLPTSQKDSVLGTVVEYLLAGRPPGDPVNLDALNVEIDYPRALRICELLDAMSTDAAIHKYTEYLVDHLITRTVERNGITEECRLSEKEALRVAKELRKLADVKFPDKRNIQHVGYQIVVDALIARLRESAAKKGPFRANTWDRVAPPWTQIVENARQLVPNLADKAFVLALVGAHAYPSDPRLATTALEESREAIHHIPNLIDRGSRLITLAEAWQQADDNASAKVFLEEAWAILPAWRSEANRDAVAGKILELAHSVDPEFAASLTSTVDNPFLEHKYRQELQVKDAAKQPELARQLEHTVADPSEWSSDFAWELLRSLCSGRGQIQPHSLIRQLATAVIDSEFDQVYGVVAWILENEIARNERKVAPSLTNVFNGILDSIELTIFLGNELTGRRIEVTNSRAEVPVGLKLFSAGSREHALEILHEWLADNVEGYVKIYDPYFTDRDMVILRSIPSDVRVTVITTWKAQEGVSFGDTESLRKRLLDAWNQVVDQRPPGTRFYVFGVQSSGDSPLHERFIVTSHGRGLRLGTSHGGLGKKDSDIREMGVDETRANERERIDEMIH